MRSLLQHYIEQARNSKPSCGLISLARYYQRWRKSIVNAHNPLEMRIPWINYPAVDYLSCRLRCGQSIFEYGSGGSTLFFLSKGLKVYSVEHDDEWYQKVSEVVRGDQYQSNWVGYLRPPSASNQVSNSMNFADPKCYGSSGPKYSGYSFLEYAQSIDAYSENYFDCVLVDGRARPSCMMHASCKVKPGGYLVLDNTERTHYHTPHLERYLGEFAAVLDAYGPTVGLCNFTRATVWRKTKCAARHSLKTDEQKSAC